MKKMIRFTLNNKIINFGGDPALSLLDFLRNDQKISSAKDGCSGQAACGACTVEIDGRARLACVIKMATLKNRKVITMEGIPEHIRNTIAYAFVNKGAVQCGFCTPGLISRTKTLLKNNPDPSLNDIQKALKYHICRCTGYKKIEQAIQLAASNIQQGKSTERRKTSGKIGIAHPKYGAFETALGKKKFTDDLFVEGMFHGALKFTEHPKAKILRIDISAAKSMEGVIGVFTANDIPGNRKTGLIKNDWSVMVGENEITHYIGDILAGVVAIDQKTARKAVALIEVEYEILIPVTDVFEAIDGDRVHRESPNHFDTTKVKTGSADLAFEQAGFISEGRYETQRIEHGFLEVESALAYPSGTGIHIFSQSQGVYEDQRQIAGILDISNDKVRVTQVPNGGGFGGKEDLSIQGHAACFAYLLQKPVKLSLSREESIRLHPKRHPVFMDIKLGADINGKLTALKLRAVGDTGAYASVGTKVMERVAGHAAGAYYIPNVDIETKTVYTNNIPSGAMRGFGANQVCFALEACVDEICEQGGFDKWTFRYDNALVDGLRTATGQKVFGVGIRACLDAIRSEYAQANHTGLACAIKNSGVGNGMIDESKVIIKIESIDKVILSHGWTEMGQGVHNMALQTLCEETGLDPEIIELAVDTEDMIKTGMTTSSRATALVGLAIMDACKELKKDLKKGKIKTLVGKSYFGKFICNWTNKPGEELDESIIHYSYGYAAQLCILDDVGKIKKIVAAHDGGKIMNPMLFEGQIEGAVHMGIGYALSEQLPMKNGYLISDKMKDLGILKAHETPEIEVKLVEVPDLIGPYGAKGIGEIGLVPTAAAISNAISTFEGKRRYKLPLYPKK